MSDSRSVSARVRGSHLHRPGGGAPTGTSNTRRSTLTTVPTTNWSDLDRAAALLDSVDTAVFLPHIHPDADALGSALALGIAMQRRGCHAAVALAEPGLVPESLRGLPGQHLLTPPERLPSRPDLVVTVDVGSAERLGSLQPMLSTPTRGTLVIDHHPSNTRFGDHHLVDPAAEATVLLVARLLDRLGTPIDRDIAENLYAGLATDTHNFRHASGQCHLLAARLVEAGVRPADLLRPIFDTHPFAWLGMLSTVLGRAELDRDAARGGGLVHTAITLDDAAALRPEELDSVIDILRTASEASVAAVLKETGPHRWQVSLRAQPGTDVSAVAASLGGGGHVRAAGFTHHGEPATAITSLTEALGR